MSPFLIILAIALNTAVGLLFVSAAIGKVRAWSEFQGVVQNYRLAPEPVAALAARALPPLELLLGILMTANVGAVAPVAGAALLSVFAVAMAINLFRGRSHISCGCFRAGAGDRIGWPAVGRNIVLAVALFLLSPATGEGSPWLWLNGAVGGLVLFAAYTALSSLFKARSAFSEVSA